MLAPFERTSTRCRSGQAIVVIVLVALLILTPFLYALSVGPAFVLADKRVITEGSLRWAYQPLFIAARTTGMQPLLEAYVEWWCGPD
jgi:hypothetical protein